MSGVLLVTLSLAHCFLTERGQALELIASILGNYAMVLTLLGIVVVILTREATLTHG